MACVWACATAAVQTGGPDGGIDATVDGMTSCPQFNLQTDPQHCGTCTTVCPSGEVCTQGACKATCDPPTVKCSGEAGICADITSDPNNCGACFNSCSSTIPDAGPDTGTGNPDSGVPPPDGGFDAGTGWSFPAGDCDASKCSLVCGGASALCSDNLCWDLQNAHDHCGSCTTPCQADVQWCTHGNCCSTGQEYCGSACTSVLTDVNNCGSCGNVCPTSAPVCINGGCSKQVAVNTVCGLTNTSGILCSGNCSSNHAQYADAYCKLAGYTQAVSYTVLTSGSVSCLYYNTQNTVPTMCSQILGPTSYGLASYCDAVQNLECE